MAKESISSANNAAASATTAASRRTLPKPKRSPSLGLTLAKSESRRSTLADTTTTKVHATSDATSPNQKSTKIFEASDKERGVTEEPKTKPLQGKTETPNKKEQEDTLKQGPNGDLPKLDKQLDGTAADARNPSGAWFGWLSGPGAEPDQTSKAKGEITDVSTAPGKSKESTNTPDVPTTRTGSAPKSNKQDVEISKGDSEHKKQDAETTTKPEAAPTKRSWLQMWNDSGSQSDQESSNFTNEPTKAPDKKALQIPDLGNSSKAASTNITHSKASSLETSPPPPLTGDGGQSSGWVFWSTKERKPNQSSESEPHVGEIAISGEASQARPKRMSISVPNENRQRGPESDTRPATATAKETVLATKPKDGRPATPAAKAQDLNAVTGESPATKKKEKLKEKPKEKTSEAGLQLQKSIPNLLLPAFKDTFAFQESPSLLQQLGRLFYYTEDSKLKHLHRLRDPPRIKRAIAIGVHGFFPAPIIRTVLGQPTGTSIKFTDLAARAIKKYTQARGYSCEVDTAALEGEGRIAERVEVLWKLLLNWIDKIRKADVIMFACHSQGVPVAMMLIAKLIDFGCFDKNAVRVGVCAMAGVSMGPFADYKSRWISGTAGELFEFTDPGSRVSRSYLAALETVLNFGARVSFIGSIDDQLVSLESSVFAPVSHPHIYRAVFIDGRFHASNFISHLVGFALKLRNLGVADHGLIKELSTPLAGSLYSGEGHSRIYDDEAVYELALEFTLETTSMASVSLTGRPGGTTMSPPNPYILPFAMRGMLEEDFVKTELHNEAVDLLQQFDKWQPTTRQLKDVKFRLEGIRSRL